MSTVSSLTTEGATAVALNQKVAVLADGTNATSYGVRYVNDTRYSNGSQYNQSGATAAGPAINLTPYELWAQLIFFYAFLAGIMSTTCSILIWVGIWKKRSLRTRFFVIVGCLTFCRTWICVSFFVMSVFRSLRTLKVVDASQPRLLCHFIHLGLINGWTIEMFLLCTLVVDRVVAIVASNYYRLLTAKSAFHLCVAEYIILSILKLLPSYLGDDMLAKAQCINLYSFLNNYFNEYSQYIDLVMVAVIMVLYIALIIYVRIRVKDMKSSTDKASEAANVALQRQLKLMPILRNLVLLHCGLALSSKVLLTLSSVVPEYYQQRMTAYGGAVSCMDVFTNVTMLLFTNADVRRAALPCWYKGEVEPSRVTHGHITLTNPRTTRPTTMQTSRTNVNEIVPIQ